MTLNKPLTQQEIIQETIAETMGELTAPKKPLQKSRVWQDPKGYQYLAVWQNAALLRVLVRKFTLNLTLNHPFERRLKAQLDDAARSQKRNIEEGWKRPTTSEYLNFLGFAQGSLEEVRGDIRDAKTDKFLRGEEGSNLRDIGINLNVFKGPSKGQAKGEPTDPGHPYYQPLITLNPNTLTFEMFMELINKTDYLLRALVQSLEKKLREDQKGYRIEQERIKDKFRQK